MTIQYVGGKSFTNPVAGGSGGTLSLTDLTGGIASSPAAGDLVVAIYMTGTETVRSITITPEYTTVLGLNRISTRGTNFVMYRKIMGSTPDTTLTYSGTGSSTDSGVILVQVWRGVDQNYPLTPYYANNNGVNSGLADPPSFLPLTTNTVVIAGGSGSANGSAPQNPYTSSDLTNFLSSNTINATHVGQVGIGYQTWSSGVVNPAAFTGGGGTTGDAWVGLTMGVIPNGDPYPKVVTISKSSLNATTSSSVTTPSFIVDSVSNQKLLIFSSLSINETLDSATTSTGDTVIPFTSNVSLVDSGKYNVVKGWYVNNPTPSSTYTVTVNRSGTTSTRFYVNAILLGNVANGAPKFQNAYSSTTYANNYSTTDFTTTSNTNLVIDVINVLQNTFPTATSANGTLICNMESVVTNTAKMDIFARNIPSGSVVTQNANYTVTANLYNVGILSFAFEPASYPSVSTGNMFMLF